MPTTPIQCLPQASSIHPSPLTTTTRLRCPPLWLQHSPLSSGARLRCSPLAPTTRLLRPPVNSGNIRKPSHILGVSVKIVVFDGSGDHHRVPLDFWHPPLASGIHHSPLSFDAHHSPSALTSRLRCPPLNSSQLLTYLLNPSQRPSGFWLDEKKIAR